MKTFRELNEALRQATDAGLLDELAAYVHPDVINRFCDAVQEASEAGNQ